MNGYQVLDVLKQEDDLLNIPIFALTANAMKKDFEKGIQAGFNEYITKPIDISNFYTLLDEYLIS